jgi:hypothetical protein
MFLKKLLSYPFRVWLAAIAIAPIAIIAEKYIRGEGEELGFVPATYCTVLLYGVLLGIIPFLIYYFSFRKMMGSNLSASSIKLYSGLIGILAINSLFFVMGRTTFYSKYFSLAIYYSAALLLTGILFRLKKEES